MRLFLQIDITDWQKRSYLRPLAGFASSLASDLLSADLDSQSENTVIDLVIRLVDQCDAVFVAVNAEKDIPMGNCLRLFHHLLNESGKIHEVTLSGEHVLVEKLLAPLQEKFRREHSDEAVRARIEKFAAAVR